MEEGKSGRADVVQNGVQGSPLRGCGKEQRNAGEDKRRPEAKEASKRKEDRFERSVEDLFSSEVGCLVENSLIGVSDNVLVCLSLYEKWSLQGAESFVPRYPKLQAISDGVGRLKMSVYVQDSGKRQEKKIGLVAAWCVGTGVEAGCLVVV